MESVAIAAVTGLLMGTLPAIVNTRGNKRRHSKLEDAIGTPNGMGNVVQMQEVQIKMLQDILRWQGRHDAEHAALPCQCPTVGADK